METPESKTSMSGSNITFKELMKSFGYSQRGLSRLSGVSLPTIAALARGDRDFESTQVSNAQKIAEAFGMSIEDIILTIKKTEV